MGIRMSNGTASLLIVEDEPKIAEVVSSFLESKGYTVYLAETGREAMDLFETKSISLILLDLMLPDTTGEDFCTEIRKKSRVPIIMLTAKTAEEDLLKGLSLGADDYIMKPFSLKELYARVEAVLRRSFDNLRPLYAKCSFNEEDLIVDFEGNSVKKCRQKVNLTPNEFKIFMALIKYPNKVFTREELIRVALGDEFEGYDRAIDSHIKNLRQKIETDPRNPKYVLTVHGIGYKFGGGQD